MSFLKISLFSLALGLVLLNTTSQAAAEATLKCQERSPEMWDIWHKFQPKDAKTKKKGIVLLSHGLMDDASLMVDLIQIYNDAGYDVLFSVLTGHEFSSTFKKELETVTRMQWLEDLYSGYCAARANADAEHLPLIFSGYSLSGLLMEDLLENFPQLHIAFDKMILFAPAISLNFWDSFVLAGNIFGNSFIPKNPFVPYPAPPMGSYNAVYDSAGKLNSSTYAHSIFPTLILIDPADELVNTAGIVDIIRQHHMNNWSLVELSTRNSTAPYPAAHMIINRAGVGPVEWTQVEKMGSPSKQGA